MVFLAIFGNIYGVGTKGLFACRCCVCCVYLPSAIVNSLNLAMREVGATYPNVADVCAYISYRWVIFYSFFIYSSAGLNTMFYCYEMGLQTFESLHLA